VHSIFLTLHQQVLCDVKSLIRPTRRFCHATRHRNVRLHGRGRQNLRVRRSLISTSLSTSLRSEPRIIIDTILRPVLRLRQTTQQEKNLFTPFSQLIQNW